MQSSLAARPSPGRNTQPLLDSFTVALRSQPKNNKLARSPGSTQLSRRLRLPLLFFLACFCSLMPGLLTDYFKPAGKGLDALPLRAASSARVAPVSPRTPCHELHLPPPPTADSLPVPSARLLGSTRPAPEASETGSPLSTSPTPTATYADQDSTLSSPLFNAGLPAAHQATPLSNPDLHPCDGLPAEPEQTPSTSSSPLFNAGLPAAHQAIPLSNPDLHPCDRRTAF